MGDKYLKGKAAMVTGGASGMGRAMALALAEAGADVAIGSLLARSSERTKEGELVHLPGEDALNKTKGEIEAKGVRCLAMELDVTSTESVNAFYKAAADEFGKVDILCAAAGITAEQRVAGHSDDLWEKVMDVNAGGTFRAIRAALPGMIGRKWGRIVCIASTAASVGAETSGAYCASKAAVVGLMRCVALEGAAHGVTCNSISPGWVETDFGKSWMTDIAEKQESRSGKEYIDEQKSANPQGRMIQPEEIGNLAAFLCKDESIGITMQDLTVSAGSIW